MQEGSGDRKEAGGLKIGYLWQSDKFAVGKLAATHLHIDAVVAELERREHAVRMVTMPGGEHSWSDDRRAWQRARLGVTSWRSFRAGESVVRGVQSRLNLPYWNLFESLRFSDAVVAVGGELDVLYERHWLLSTGGLLAARRLGIPLILEVNGDVFEEYAHLGIELSNAQWWVLRFLNRMLFQRCDHVIAVSEPLRRRLMEQWSLPPDKVTTVHNGARVGLFAGGGDDGSRDGHNGRQTIAFVGTFKPWHGLDLLLDAFAMLAPSHPQLRLLLVGDGPLREEMEARTEALGLTERVTYTGKVPQEEAAALLRNADVAVVNPRMTSAAIVQSPLKLFEYMAAGKAIVAPAMPNIEAILTHRENGYLVAPDDAGALAAGLSDCLLDAQLRCEMGRRAQAEALAQYSWAETVTKIETIMRRVLASR